jgi:hypothetical protein
VGNLPDDVTEDGIREALSAFFSFAEAMGLPFYSYLGAMLDEYLRDLPRHVTVVSVNNGLLLKTPLDCDMSIGFISENVATYSTFPRALRGASLMSVTMAFFGSFGSSSPYAFPDSRS